MTPVPGPDWWYRAVLDSAYEGAQVSADLLELERDALPGRRCQLRVRAYAPGAEHLRVRFVRGHAYPFGRALGIQDELVGDVELDERFVIKTNDPALLREWLDAPARAALLAASEFSFWIERGAIHATGQGRLDEPHPLAAGLRACATIATRARRVETSLRALADTLGAGCHRDRERQGSDLGQRLVLDLPGDAGAQIRVVVGGLPGLWRARGVHTRVSARRVGAAIDGFVVHRAQLALGTLGRLRAAGGEDRFRFRGENIRLVRARLTEARRAALDALEPAAVVGDAVEIAVWLDGFVQDAARLLQAAALAADLADEVGTPGASGPFR